MKCETLFQQLFFPDRGVHIELSIALIDDIRIWGNSREEEILKNSSTPYELIWILSIRNRDDFDIDIFIENQRKRAHRRLHSCIITIKTKIHLFHKSFQNLDMPLSESCTTNPNGK